jgi:hypothetical protein
MASSKPKQRGNYALALDELKKVSKNLGLNLKAILLTVICGNEPSTS